MVRFLFLMLLAAALALAVCQTGPRLRGQVIAPTPAADFGLTTQAGQKITLLELQGRVVVLTFLDTACTGDCPGITERIVQASDEIDYSEAGRVAFLAVTTAPDTDSIEAAAQFCHLKNVPSNFYFLTGPRAHVEAVWASYRQPPPGTAATSERLVLIDPLGRMRAYMAGPEFTPQDLRHNIRSLLLEENLLEFPICH